MPTQPLAHHHLFLFLLQMGALLLSARICGEIARKLRFPAVVGEILGGVLLSASVFGGLWPQGQAALFPPSQMQSDLMSVVTWLGVIFLLLTTGLETDLALMRKKAGKAAAISIGGMILPFVAGFWLGYILPGNMLGSMQPRFTFALFVATAMSISAVPVLARVLIDMKLIKRDIGQLTLASGMIDDTVGWVLLSLVAGLASAGQLDGSLVLKAVGALSFIILFSATVGKRLVAGVVEGTARLAGKTGQASAIVMLALLASAATIKLGMEAVLGAFLVGILLRQAPRFRKDWVRGIEQMTQSIFAPIFFAAAGLKINLGFLHDRQMLLWALGILGVACAGKFLGAYLGARMSGLNSWEGLAIGAGLNARGAMEIIVATLGLSLGVLSIDMYSIIVMVAITTSLMAPPILAWCFARIKPTVEETERQEKSEREERSFWGNLDKVLIPTRGGGNVSYAAMLLRAGLTGCKARVSVLNLYETGDIRRFPDAQSNIHSGRSAVNRMVRLLLPLKTSVKAIRSKGRDLAEMIASYGDDHDLIVLGASDEHDYRPFTFSTLVDEVLRFISIPVLVVRYPDKMFGGFPIREKPISKILVPTTWTRAAEGAMELGVKLAQTLGATCTFLYIEEHEFAPNVQPASNFENNASIKVRTVRGDRAGDMIVREATEGKFDLIILNATLRPGLERAYLGPQVDMILDGAPCPVAVLATM